MQRYTGAQSWAILASQKGIRYRDPWAVPTASVSLTLIGASGKMLENGTDEIRERVDQHHAAAPSRPPPDDKDVEPVFPGVENLSAEER